jgi:hypothetical protein
LDWFEEHKGERGILLMKARVVKFDCSYIYLSLGNDPNSVRLGDRESENKNLTEGPIIFSLKKGKRRKLVKGRIEINWEYHLRYDEQYREYYFFANNPTKLREIVQASTVKWKNS